MSTATIIDPMRHHCIGVYDKRTGAANANLQFKTWTEILGRPWNTYEEWSCTGGGGEAEDQLQYLIDQAHIKGRRVIAGALHNNGASVAIALKEDTR
jgi:hypothetical protein